MIKPLIRNKWLPSLLSPFLISFVFFTIVPQLSIAQNVQGARLDDIVIEVIESDLDIANIPAKNPVYVHEDTEETIGGYVPLNRDADNKNGTPDLKDSGAINGEDDLLIIKLETWRASQEIPVTLTATKGGDKIRVWTGPQRTTKIDLPITWKGKEAERGWMTPGNKGETEQIPDILYIEGIEPSNSLGDVVLKLCVGTCEESQTSWLSGPGNDTHVDSVALTVIDFDISFPGLNLKENETDIHIGYNDDDDDNDIDDNADLDNLIRPIKGENDTRTIKVTVKPFLENRAEVSLTVEDGIKLWRSESANKVFLDPASTQKTKKLERSDQDKKFYAEGVNFGTKNLPEITLEVDFANMVGTWTDKIKLAVAQADISIADFTDSGEKEYFEGGYVTKSESSPSNVPDEKDLTTLLLSANVSPGKSVGKTCIDLEIAKGLGDFRLFTKKGNKLQPLTVVNCPTGGFTPETLPEKIYVQGLNSTGDSSIELKLHFWQKTTKGTFGIVHSDRISLTVLGDDEGLWILPPLVFIPGESGVRNLQVFLIHQSEVAEVTTHDDTEYHWIGKTYTGNSIAAKAMKTVAIAAFDRGLEEFNKAAEDKYGINPGLKRITDFEVNKGKLIARESGMQLVWATHPDTRSVNWTLVFVGLVLDEIQLEPVSMYNLPHILMTKAFGGSTTKNLPLILSADDNGWITDKGQIILEEITFQLLKDGPKVPLGSSLAALTEVARNFSVPPLAVGLAPYIGPAAPFVANMFSHGVSGGIRKGTKLIATNFVKYKTSDKSIADVKNASFSSLKFGGMVKSGVPGFVGIKGTLDLEELSPGLGMASDTVVTWVLPDLESVDIETISDAQGNHTTPILINTQKPAEPGPPVRAFARTNITKLSEIEFDKKAVKTSLAAAGTILPKAMLPLLSGNSLDLNGKFNKSKFRFELTGSIGLTDRGPKKAAIQLNNFQIGFHVPNNIPILQQFALSNNWLIKDPSIVQIDPNNIKPFDIHLLHQGLNQVGKTEISTTVALTGMGSATATRLVETTNVLPTMKDKLVITPPTATIVLGVTPNNMAQYTATRKYADGRKKDVSSRAIWSGSDKMIARLEQDGRALGLSPGKITVQATDGGLTSNQAELIVVKPKPGQDHLQSCEILPSKAQARIGEIVTFTVFATSSNGEKVNIISGVKWVSGDPAVATIVGGEAMAKSNGQADIMATYAKIECVPAKLVILSDPPKLTPHFLHAGAAVALGDLDEDGDLDAFVANYGDPNTVWLNNGDGSFTWSGEYLGEQHSTAVALGDLDHDGDLDAYVTNFNQYDRIWLNDGKGFLKVARKKYDSVRIESAKEPLVLDTGKGRGVALGDIDKDGDLDVFIAREGQPDRVWLNTGSNVELREDKTAIEELSSDSMDVAFGDFDQDGDLDAVVVTDHGDPNKLWLNEDVHFNNSEYGPGRGNSRAVVLADFDGDTIDDAFVVNGAGDDHEIWLNLTGDKFDKGQRIASFDDTAAAAGDLDGDGDKDVYVVSKDRSNRILLNDGTGTFKDSKIDFRRAKSTGIALGDLDGDGDLDAFIVNDGEPDYVWLNEDFGKPGR